MTITLETAEERAYWLDWVTAVVADPDLTMETAIDVADAVVLAYRERLPSRAAPTERIEVQDTPEPSELTPDAPVWPDYPPPGWRSEESQNIHKPWSCSQIGDCTHTYATEQDAVDAAWEAWEDANGRLCTPGDAGLRERVESVIEWHDENFVDSTGRAMTPNSWQSGLIDRLRAALDAPQDPTKPSGVPDLEP